MLNMLPTAATALSAAQLAQVFENGAHFLMTSIGSNRRDPPNNFSQTRSREGIDKDNPGS